MVSRKEEARFSLADLNLVTETLIEAIKHCKQHNIPQVLTQHIVEYFEDKAKTITLPYVAQRLDEMARTMKVLSPCPRNPVLIVLSALGGCRLHAN